MKKRGNIFICQRRLCIGRKEKGFALEIPCLRFHLRSWQIYIILPSCLLGDSPLFFWLGANSNGKLYGPRTHIYAPKRDGSWQQINFTPPSAWLLLQHPPAAPWDPAPFSHLPTAAFIARRFSVSVSSRLRCGIIRKMSLLVWILRNSNGGKGKMEQKTGAVGNTLRENMWKVLTGILPLFKNISLRMFAIIFWIPLGL